MKWHVPTLAAAIPPYRVARLSAAKTAKVKPGEPIGEVAARGDAEIGFHQVIELIPLKGIQYLGRCPLRCKKITVFSGGIHSGKTAAEATAALVQFLTSPAAKPTIKRHGLEPGLPLSRVWPRGPLWVLAA